MTNQKRGVWALSMSGDYCYSPVYLPLPWNRILLKKLPSIREILKERGVDMTKLSAEWGEFTKRSSFGNGISPVVLTNYLDVSVYPSYYSLSLWTGRAGSFHTCLAESQRAPRASCLWLRSLWFWWCTENSIELLLMVEKPVVLVVVVVCLFCFDFEAWSHYVALAGL